MWGGNSDGDSVKKTWRGEQQGGVKKRETKKTGLHTRNERTATLDSALKIYITRAGAFPDRTKREEGKINWQRKLSWMNKLMTECSRRRNPTGRRDARRCQLTRSRLKGRYPVPSKKIARRYGQKAKDPKANLLARQRLPE